MIDRSEKSLAGGFRFRFRFRFEPEKEAGDKNIGNPKIDQKRKKVFWVLHSTEAAFGLLTQRPKVQILARLPRFFFTAKFVRSNPSRTHAKDFSNAVNGYVQSQVLQKQFLRKFFSLPHTWLL